MAQLRNSIAQYQSELDGMQAELKAVEDALETAVDRPIEGGVDPTGWLPNELLLIPYSRPGGLRQSVLAMGGAVS